MTEATTDAAEVAAEETEAAGEYVPPATQAELNRIIGERVSRVKAQFKDHAELKAAKAELDQIKAANQTEAERLAGELTRWQTDAEQWRKAAVGNRVEALAASAGFADPTDAISALGDKNYLDAGGQIDEAAIAADLAAVLERKPHWRRPEGTAPSRVPAPNPAQGSGGGNPVANPAQEFGAILQSQLNRG